jgi:hypothetical protein
MSHITYIHTYMGLESRTDKYKYASYHMHAHTLEPVPRASFETYIHTHASNHIQTSDRYTYASYHMHAHTLAPVPRASFETCIHTYTCLKSHTNVRQMYICTTSHTCTHLRARAQESPSQFCLQKFRLFVCMCTSV